MRQIICGGKKIMFLCLLVLLWHLQDFTAPKGKQPIRTEESLTQCRSLLVGGSDQTVKLGSADQMLIKILLLHCLFLASNVFSRAVKMNALTQICF